MAPNSVTREMLFLLGAAPLAKIIRIVDDPYWWTVALSSLVRLAFVTLAEAFLEKFGGDSFAEIKRNYQGYLEQVRAF